jgi:hypothetical protein
VELIILSVRRAQANSRPFIAIRYSILSASLGSRFKARRGGNQLAITAAAIGKVFYCGDPRRAPGNLHPGVWAVGGLREASR